MTHRRFGKTRGRERTPRAAALLLAALLPALASAVDTNSTEAPRIRVAVRELEAVPHAIALPGKVGVLEAAASLELSFEVSGRVERIVGQGGVVEQGDEVAALDSELEDADLLRAELLLQDARSELKRLRDLQASRAASESALDSARTAAGLRRAERDAASERLARRRLVARFDGVLADVRLDPGEVAVPGKPIARLLNFDLMLLELGVPAHQVTRVATGASVKVEIPALANELFAGTVHHVAPSAADGGTLFEVEVLIPNSEQRLREGMGARAFVVTDEIPEALVLPLSASVQRNGQRVVFFVAEGRAHAVPVEDAVLDGDRLVLSTSIPHRTLVIRGQHDLDEGMRVRVDNSILTGQVDPRAEDITAEVVSQ
jgi:RND family efflux transporter MFP subunit